METVFSWEAVLELVKTGRKLRGGRTPLGDENGDGCF
jgi:hypothetical protein